MRFRGSPRLVRSNHFGWNDSVYSTFHMVCWPWRQVRYGFSFRNWVIWVILHRSCYGTDLERSVHRTISTSLALQSCWPPKTGSNSGGSSQLVDYRVYSLSCMIICVYVGTLNIGAHIFLCFDLLVIAEHTCSNWNKLQDFVKKPRTHSPACIVKLCIFFSKVRSKTISGSLQNCHPLPPDHHDLFCFSPASTAPTNPGAVWVGFVGKPNVQCILGDAVLQTILARLKNVQMFNSHHLLHKTCV